MLKRIAGWYRLLLRAYPPQFRETFGAEAQGVFGQALGAAAARGRWAVFELCWRELRDWPAAAAQEYWREWRQRMLDEPQVSRLEQAIPWLALLAALVLYLIPPFHTVLTIIVVVVGIAVAGIVLRLPRWWLPFAGAILGVGVLAGLSGLFAVWDTALGQLARRVVDPSSLLSRLVWQFHFPLLFWLGMLAGLALLLAVSALVPPLRPFYRRLRRDWTLAPFLLYGAVLIQLIIDLDEYQHEGLVMLLCAIWLTAGAWGHLRSASPTRRLAALLLGATLAMATMAIGKWLIVPLQDWPIWFRDHPPESERWFEALRAIPAWLCLAAALGVAALSGAGSGQRGRHASA